MEGVGAKEESVAEKEEKSKEPDIKTTKGTEGEAKSEETEDRQNEGLKPEQEAKEENISESLEDKETKMDAEEPGAGAGNKEAETGKNGVV